MKYTSHNKICFACGQEKRRRQLGYDVRTLKTYCKGHCPNASDIPKVELVELRTEDLKLALEKHYSEELLQVFHRILGKTVSARPNPALAMHIMKVAQKHDLTSISETINFILERDFKDHEIMEDLAPIEQAEEVEEVQAEVVEPEPEPEPEPTPVPEEIKIIINEKPIEVEPEEEKEDDDVFTF